MSHRIVSFGNRIGFGNRPIGSSWILRGSILLNVGGIKNLEFQLLKKNYKNPHIGFFFEKVRLRMEM